MRSSKSSSTSSSFNKNNHFKSSEESEYENEIENNSSSFSSFNQQTQNQNNQNHKKNDLFSIINSFLCIKKFKLLISNFSIVLLLISSSFKVYQFFILNEMVDKMRWMDEMVDWLRWLRRKESHFAFISSHIFLVLIYDIFISFYQSHLILFLVLFRNDFIIIHFIILFW